VPVEAASNNFGLLGPRLTPKGKFVVVVLFGHAASLHGGVAEREGMVSGSGRAVSKQILVLGLSFETPHLVA
jgi:hypothetical protein